MTTDPHDLDSDPLDARLRRAFRSRDEELERLSDAPDPAEWPAIRDGFRATMSARRNRRPIPLLVGGLLAAAALAAIVVYGPWARGDRGSGGGGAGDPQLGPQLGPQPGPGQGTQPVEEAETPIELLEFDGDRLRLRLDDDTLGSGFYSVRILSLEGRLLAETTRHDAPVWSLEDASSLAGEAAVRVEVSTWIDWGDGEAPERGRSWSERVSIE